MRVNLSNIEAGVSDIQTLVATQMHNGPFAGATEDTSAMDLQMRDTPNAFKTPNPAPIPPFTQNPATNAVVAKITIALLVRNILGFNS